MAIDEFEVYYFQNGRWHVHARYEANERELAVQDAQSVEYKLGYPARVVRETFYPETNTTEEVVTYQGERAKKIADADNMFGPRGGSSTPPSQGRASGGGQSRGDSRQKQTPPAKSAPPKKSSAPATSARAEPPQQKRRRRKKTANAFVQLLLGFFSSLLIAVIGAFAIAMIVIQLQGAGAISPANRTPLIFGTFIFFFLVSAFLSLNKQFNLVALFRGPNKAARHKTPPPPTVPKQKSEPKGNEASDLADMDLDAIRARVGLADAIEEESQEDELKSLDGDGFEDPDQTKKDKKKDSKEDDKKSKAEEEKKKKEAEKEKKAKAKAEEEKKKKEAEQKKKKEQKPKGPEETLKPQFLHFLTDAVTSIQADHPQLNAFSKFGMNLYLSGACSTIAKSGKLSQEALLRLLREGLTLIGTQKERIQAFCDELASYGQNPRYAGMIQAGSQAMANYLSGQKNANAGLSALLTEWNLPEKRPSVPNVYTFLFTDIVGSTAMTQRLGNAGAQRAVRAHNDAVRGAIQTHRGHEVKHTGDGIMATFPDGPSAVAASIDMLRGISSHNQANPNVTLQIRIGINTGEAVAEENDFFGQAVQMTARICDKAADGQAWVSEGVMEASRGTAKFVPRGEYEMKGIERPKPLFEVAWTDAHRDELADL